MSVTARQRICSIVAIAAALFSMEAIGKEFAVRPVTHFGGQPIVPWAVPLTVAGNHLLLSAEDNDGPRMYRTDGSSIQVIDATASIRPHRNVEGGIERATLGDSVYFPAVGNSGVSTLHATDGNTVRQIAGAAHSAPKDFEIVNGNLVFEAGLSQLFHTDGTTVENFPLAKSNFANAARVNNRLMFAGYPVGGGTVHAYSTDGRSISTITADGQSLGGPQHMTEVGGAVYFVAGGVPDFAIYRTSDGLIAEKFADFDDFMIDSRRDCLFAFQDSLYVQANGISNSERVFYKSSGDQPTEVLRSPLPADVFPSSGNSPLFVDANRAYFKIDRGLNASLYAFDGDSFDEVDLKGNYDAFEFAQLGGRTFLNARRLFESSALYELIDDNFVHLGPSLDSMTLFQGELFGINNRLPNTFQPTTLFRTENGQLIPLGNVGRVQSPDFETRFVEFDGRLYFSGGISPIHLQLFAVVEVPEPAVWMSYAAVPFAVALAHARTRRKRK